MHDAPFRTGPDAPFLRSLEPLRGFKNLTSVRIHLRHGSSTDETCLSLRKLREYAEQVILGPENWRSFVEMAQWRYDDELYASPSSFVATACTNILTVDVGCLPCISCSCILLAVALVYILHRLDAGRYHINFDLHDHRTQSFHLFPLF